jgi:hypothetical protein
MWLFYLKTLCQDSIEIRDFFKKIEKWKLPSDRVRSSGSGSSKMLPNELDKSRAACLVNAGLAGLWICCLFRWVRYCWRRLLCSLMTDWWSVSDAVLSARMVQYHLLVYMRTRCALFPARNLPGCKIQSETRNGPVSKPTRESRCSVGSWLRSTKRSIGHADAVRVLRTSSTFDVLGRVPVRVVNSVCLALTPQFPCGIRRALIDKIVDSVWL